LDKDVVNRRPAICPHCGAEGQLFYTRRMVHHVEGYLEGIDEDLLGTMHTPVLAGEGGETFEQDEERVECMSDAVTGQGCDTVWFSFDDFAICALAEDHEQECAL
jgi:hypothetical protein